MVNPVGSAVTSQQAISNQLQQRLEEQRRNPPSDTEQNQVQPSDKKASDLQNVEDDKQRQLALSQQRQQDETSNNEPPEDVRERGSLLDVTV